MEDTSKQKSYRHYSLNGKTYTSKEDYERDLEQFCLKRDFKKAKKWNVIEIFIIIFLIVLNVITPVPALALKIKVIKAYDMFKYNGISYFYLTGESRMYKEMTQIPDSITTLFENDGGTYTDQAEQFNNNTNGLITSNVEALFDRNTMTIAYSDDQRFEGVNWLAHEMGHYLDAKLNDISQSDEFMEIWEDEHVLFEKVNKGTITFSLYDDDDTTRVVEYFAECFSEYYNCPDVLKASAPRTYKYFSELLENY